MDLHPFRDLLQVVLRNGKRVAVLVVGIVLVVAGLAMLVLPGPGLLLIVAGLAVLATEFAWAEHLLDKAKDQAGKAKDRAGGMLRRRPPPP
ncbi:MAG: PGPGW domain-containing protein [Acidimicrobiia bacterium]